jgi:hypothetical protein
MGLTIKPIRKQKYWPLRFIRISLYGFREIIPTNSHRVAVERVGVCVGMGVGEETTTDCRKCRASCDARSHHSRWSGALARRRVACRDSRGAATANPRPLTPLRLCSPRSRRASVCICMPSRSRLWASSPSLAVGFHPRQRCPHPCHRPPRCHVGGEQG